MANALVLDDRRGWRVVGAAYLILYGLLLWHTDGLPYAIDNNESFSSLEHARNLHQVSWLVTKGLTDEVAAWKDSASPFIHTHQGNIPRVFSYFLYLVGARSIQSQIVLTTFSVGLLAVWFAFRFLRSIGPPGFAVVGCLVLITDYGLFGQWQVNTYRVWYGFFFFSSLLWVEAGSRRKGWILPVLGILNFAGMFYGEYVYASFVGLTSVGYACFIYRRRFWALAQVILIEVMGACTAGAILLAQLVAYMGWANVKQDIRYTTQARNMAFDQAFADKANRFYAEHHIVFFQNFQDISAFRNGSYFLESLFTYHFQYYSSTICFSFLIVLAACLVGIFRFRVNDAEESKPTRFAIAVRIIYFSSFGAGTFYLCEKTLGQFDSFGGAGRTVPVLIAATGYTLLAIFAASRSLRDRSNGQRLISWDGMVRAAIVLGFSIWLVGLRTRFFGDSVEDHWLLFSKSWITQILCVLALLGSFEVALSISAVGSQRLFAFRFNLTRFFGFSCALLLAYAVVYSVFTGYVLSGYLHRQAPFLVYWTDILLAAAFYFIFEAAARAFSDRRIIATVAAGTTVTLLLGAWIATQVAYYRILPPSHYSFLHLLDKAPFRGKTFVVDNYAAPVAEMTHAWAYAESSIFSGQLRLTGDGFVTEHDTKYLWFADAATNREYLKPDYGLKIAQPASIHEALNQFNPSPVITRPAVSFPSIGSVDRSLSAMQAFLQDKFVASDGASYTIIGFDWDFPPFLRPVDPSIKTSAEKMTLRQRMAVSRMARAFHRHWRVEMEPLGETWGKIPRPLSSMVAAATIDGKELLSPQDLNSNKAWVRMVDGDNIAIRLRAPADGGQLRLAVNDMNHVFDSRTLRREDQSLSFSLDQPYGKHTSVANFPAGEYVKTRLVKRSLRSIAEITYHFDHQEKRSEENTTIRMYSWDRKSPFRLIDTIVYLGPDNLPVRLAEFTEKNPDTLAEYSRVRVLGDRRSFEQWLGDHIRAHPTERSRPGIIPVDRGPNRLLIEPHHGESIVVREIPMPTQVAGWCQFSVTPGTSSKAGPEYFGLPFSLSEFGDSKETSELVSLAPPGADKGLIPFGALRIRLKFPAVRGNWAEPLVSTGIEEAGDFVYVTYSDPTHIRIGLDHWFNGGPLTPPIAIDFSIEHTIEISMGSLFPAQGDFLFEGVPVATASKIRNALHVVLDGTTVLDSAVKFYDSTPEQVTVGANLIKGTTSNLRFTGDILECHRVWPDELDFIK